jgi:hypothetical protein
MEEGEIEGTGRAEEMSKAVWGTGSYNKQAQGLC